ncbi:MAG: nucleoside transporter [Phycisphaeraceae bacterium]
MIYLRAFVGIVVLLSLAWLMSANRRRFPWRVVVWGIGLQVVLAALILGTGVGIDALESAKDFVVRLIQVNERGTKMVFGNDLPARTGAEFIFAFASSGLIVIIFFSALMSVLYHLGIMQVIIWVMAKIMSALMGVSGAESMAMAANIFAGQTEAPLVVRPYIPTMTMSELNALMTGGFATVAGSVLAVYIGVVGPDVGAHLLTASLLSAPAAFVIAKIIRPEVDEPVTGRHVKLRIERTAHNLIEAAANGTQDGLKLWLNVIAMLIAFTALIELVNWPLGAAGEAWLGMGEGELSVSKVFGWVLSPLAWCLGVNNWHDCQLVGGLIGTKLAINELVAFFDLGVLLGPINEAGQHPESQFLSPRSAKLAAYAMCGFANFASIGIQLGGITPLAPERKTDLTKLALRAMLGGALASSCTAAVAGMFID